MTSIQKRGLTLFMKFRKKYKNIFLDPNVKLENTNQKVNIILSPSLYWVKKVSLPVKYTRDAKKLLVSLFEDILPEGNYSYATYKSGEDFYIFAYEDKKILDLLSTKGIAISHVVNFYFAQSELNHIDSPLKIDEAQSLYLKDDILLLVNSSWMQTNSYLNTENLELSNHTITLKQFGHIIDNKSLYKIGAIILALSFLVFAEFLITKQKVDEITQLKSELFIKNDLKPTMIQNKSMLKRYNNIHTKQIKLREYISYILRLKLKNEEKLLKLNLEENSLKAEFIGVGEKTRLSITKTLKDKKLKIKSLSKDKSWHLEILL